MKNQTTATRAPKGGVTIANVFYHGGQFLPSNNEPKRGAFSANKNKALDHKSTARFMIIHAIKSYLKYNDARSADYSLTIAQCSIRKYEYVQNQCG